VGFLLSPFEFLQQIPCKIFLGLWLRLEQSWHCCISSRYSSTSSKAVMLDRMNFRPRHGDRNFQFSQVWKRFVVESQRRLAVSCGGRYGQAFDRWEFRWSEERTGSSVTSTFSNIGNLLVCKGFTKENCGIPAPPQLWILRFRSTGRTGIERRRMWFRSSRTSPKSSVKNFKVPAPAIESRKFRRMSR